MADENADDIAGDLDEGSSGSKKGGGLKGAFPQLLKWILIGVAAVIFIVTVVVITTLVINRGGKAQTVVPVGVEYTQQREILDWYTSLDQIRTNSSDPIPASIVVQVVLGYKKDDKAASTEITARRVEITDFLRRYFAEHLAEDLVPQKEEILRQDIRDQINDEILSGTSIRDVRFTTKDVITQ